MLRKIQISGNSQIKLYKIFSNFFKLGGGPGLVVVQAVVSSNASTGSFSHLLLKNWRFSISKEYRKEVVDWPFNKNLFYRFFLAPVHDGRCRGGQLELPGRLCPHRRPVCPLWVVHVLTFSPTSSGFSHLRSWHDCAGKVIFLWANWVPNFACIAEPESTHHSGSIGRFGIDQTIKTVVKQLKPNKINKRSAVQWCFPWR